jgi:hypothetical protein
MYSLFEAASVDLHVYQSKTKTDKEVQQTWVEDITLCWNWRKSQKILKVELQNSIHPLLDTPSWCGAKLITHYAMKMYGGVDV